TRCSVAGCSRWPSQASCSCDVRAATISSSANRSPNGSPNLPGVLSERIDRVRARMQELDVDVLLLSVGPDLPYLTGYEAMPLERLTMLVLPAGGDASLVVPRLAAPRVSEHLELFSIVSWDVTGDV